MTSSFFSDEDKLAAERIIDQIFNASMAIELDEDELDRFVFEEGGDDSGYNADDSATTEEICADDTNTDVYSTDDTAADVYPTDDTNTDVYSPDVVYVIEAADSPSVYAEALSIASPQEPEMESDESWSPESGTSGRSSRRKPYERKATARRPRPTVVDKKERKKIQNVEAARRYR
jgi:hypothetical protein